MIRPRTVLAAASLALLLAVLLTALVAGPWLSRPWLSLSALMAIAMALLSVTSEPKDLAWALLFSAPPVAALAAEGSPTWLIGVLAAGLLIAAELNTLSWEWPAGGASDVVQRRFLEIGVLAGLGVVASLAVFAVARGPVMGPTSALVVAGGGLAALSRIVLPPSFTAPCGDPGGRGQLR